MICKGKNHASTAVLSSPLILSDPFVRLRDSAVASDMALVPHCRWAKCSWFSNPPPIHLQSTAEAAPNNDPTCKATKIGGAAAHNRFAGRSAVPLATTVPRDGSPMIDNSKPKAKPPLAPRSHSTAVPSGEPRQAAGHGSARMPQTAAPVARSRPGHTCDGSLAAERTPNYASPWKFDWEHMSWENAAGDRAAGDDVKAALAARRCLLCPALRLSLFIPENTWHQIHGLLAMHSTAASSAYAIIRASPSWGWMYSPQWRSSTLRYRWLVCVFLPIKCGIQPCHHTDTANVRADHEIHASVQSHSHVRRLSCPVSCASTPAPCSRTFKPYRMTGRQIGCSTVWTAARSTWATPSIHSCRPSGWSFADAGRLLMCPNTQPTSPSSVTLAPTWSP